MGQLVQLLLVHTKILEEQALDNRPFYVKHERIHYSCNEHDVTAGVHSSAILVGICIAFYGNVVQT